MFDQDPNECAPISGAEFAQMCDEMAALKARIAELEGKAVAVVPELTENDMREEMRLWVVQPIEVRGPAWPGHPQYATGFAKGYRLAASRLKSIPADRVLGEGQVTVNREALLELRALARVIAYPEAWFCRELPFNADLEAWGHDISARMNITKRETEAFLSALRAQAKGVEG